MAPVLGMDTIDPSSRLLSPPGVGAVSPERVAGSATSKESTYPLSSEDLAPCSSRLETSAHQPCAALAAELLVRVEQTLDRADSDIKARASEGDLQFSRRGQRAFSRWITHLPG
ncbi:MAG: hypothetical protein HY791_06760 [Deltaproteobacteria bacterium]|nr:hypothetical protein [Deltaproteobacteria bacterium]